eukprot:gene6632-6860_t
MKRWDSTQPDPCNGTSYAGVTCDQTGNIIAIEGIGNDLSLKWFPKQFGGLTSLKRLSITRTRISGPFPTAWKSLVNMQTLDMANNRISGELPKYLSNWTQLTTLNLRSNRLTGPLLESLGTTSVKDSLVDLDLSNNQLSGPVPEAYGNLTAIKAVKLAGNAGLTGCVPAGWSTNINTEDPTVLNKMIKGTGISGVCFAP